MQSTVKPSKFWHQLGHMFCDLSTTISLPKIQNGHMLVSGHRMLFSYYTGWYHWPMTQPWQVTGLKCTSKNNN